MSYSPGDWVELTRTVEGCAAGQRGKVTSTGFLGGLDIELSNGTQLAGVDPSAVKPASPGSNSGDGGCALTLMCVAAGSAALVATAVSALTRARWGA